MTISQGDRLPNATLLQIGTEGHEQIDLSDKIAGRKVVIFGVPGAFTPTCTAAHLPSFIRTKAAFDTKGIDTVMCIAVNDPFVLRAWGETTGAIAAGITMISDAASEFTKAIGLTLTAPPVGFFDRAQRYALYAEDGVVKVLNVETDPGACTISAGETLLAAI